MNLINFLVSLATFSNLINISKAQQCKQFYIRKEIRSMSSGERQAFFNALTKLHNTKPYPGVGVNKLDWFAYAHNIVYDNIHNHPVFLPWHRYYMQLFQEMIWQVDPSVIVPYWDWTIDSQAPHLSPVFTNEYFGGNGNSNNNFAIQDGFMANWSANYPNKHAIARNFQQSVNGSYVNSNEIAALPSSILMDSIINNNKIFSSFAFNAELYHGYLHYAIGGDSAEMSKHYSPNDLIFFLHHGYVDRFWWIWQKRNPDAAN
ncbi:Di-copper centre-containing protein, partial [Conidiobolus coronatus NRRL 28638]